MPLPALSRLAALALLAVALPVPAGGGGPPQPQPQPQAPPAGDPVAGRAAFRDACAACHAADDLAGRLFGAGPGDAAALCGFLETHGRTGPGQDCDIAAFLKALAAGAP